MDNEQFVEITLTPAQAKAIGYDGEHPLVLPVEVTVLTALWQDEIWAQTGWPDDVLSVAQVLDKAGR